jgi:hypothetical protein
MRAAYGWCHWTAMPCGQSQIVRLGARCSPREGTNRVASPCLSLAIWYCSRKLRLTTDKLAELTRYRKSYGWAPLEILEIRLIKNQLKIFVFEVARDHFVVDNINSSTREAHLWCSNPRKSGLTDGDLQIAAEAREMTRDGHVWALSEWRKWALEWPS